ncbi:hypothetical protein MMC07_000845 [Pseudocyphellaria aurata]|nr:hypothetical protein [Pseudocyphellaria aurata]
MVLLYQSQTFPINPPGAEPVLSLEQVWEVLVIKCRQPELFLKPFASSKVLEETETTIKREGVFREGQGPPSGRMVEDIVLHKPWKADFKGSGPHDPFVSNIISQGRDATDLYLTFYFEWPFPQIEEGTDEAKKTSETMWSMAREAVSHTIEVTREMVKEGRVSA